MGSLFSSLAEESVLLLGLISAICAAVGVPDIWTKVAVAAVPLVLAVLVRQVTTSPKKVAEVATQAALQTAENLTTKTVGAAGEVSDTGLNVATGVVQNVLSTVGGLVGSLAKGTS